MKKIDVLKWAACSFALLTAVPSAFAQQDAEIKVKGQKQEIIINDNYEIVTAKEVDFQVGALNLEEKELEKQPNVLKYLNGSNKKNYKGDKPFLGVGIETIEAGVKVTEVYKNSAAKAANLITGDVITAIDGETISTTEDLQSAIRKHQVSDQIQISYLRNGQPSTTSATLKTDKSRSFARENYRIHKYQAPKATDHTHNKYHNYGQVDQHKGNFDPCEELKKIKADPFIGVYVAPDNEKNGVDITGILNSSDASNSDLQKGDQIVKINRFKVSDYKSIQEALGNFESGDRVRIKYARNGATAKTSVTLSSKADRYPHKVMKLEKMCAEQQEVDEVLTKGNKEETTLPTIKGPSLNVFPNPAIDIVNLQFEGGIKAETTISVLDILGKVVLRQQVNENPEQFNVQVNLSELASGMYIISVQQGDQVISKQVSLK